jgi:hypothetical protein
MLPTLLLLLSCPVLSLGTISSELLFLFMLLGSLPFGLALIPLGLPERAEEKIKSSGGEFGQIYPLCTSDEW